MKGKWINRVERLLMTALKILLGYTIAIIIENYRSSGSIFPQQPPIWILIFGCVGCVLLLIGLGKEIWDGEKCN